MSCLEILQADDGVPDTREYVRGGLVAFRLSAADIVLGMIGLPSRLLFFRFVFRATQPHSLCCFEE